MAFSKPFFKTPASKILDCAELALVNEAHRKCTFIKIVILRHDILPLDS